MKSMKEHRVPEKHLDKFTHSLNSANKHISGLIVKEPPAPKLNLPKYSREDNDSPF